MLLWPRRVGWGLRGERRRQRPRGGVRTPHSARTRRCASGRMSGCSAPISTFCATGTPGNFPRLDLCCVSPMSMVGLSTILMVRAEAATHLRAPSRPSISSSWRSAHRSWRASWTATDSCASWAPRGSSPPCRCVRSSPPSSCTTRVALFIPAALAGANGERPARFVRSRWSTIRKPGQLTTAYALGSAVDEFVHHRRPRASTVLGMAVRPASGLVISITSLAVGGAPLPVASILRTRDHSPRPGCTPRVRHPQTRRPCS